MVVVMMMSANWEEETAEGWTRRARQRGVCKTIKRVAVVVVIATPFFKSCNYCYFEQRIRTSTHAQTESAGTASTQQQQQTLCITLPPMALSEPQVHSSRVSGLAKSTTGIRFGTVRGGGVNFDLITCFWSER